jgi:hypothetical protein
MFRLGDHPRAVLMDTFGLGSFGLPDLQCIHEDEPRAVAKAMYDYALYLFEKGDVLADGDTVDGHAPGQRWQVRHEVSAIDGRPVRALHRAAMPRPWWQLWR